MLGKPEGKRGGQVVRDDREETIIVGHVDVESAEEELDQRLKLQVGCGFTEGW